MQKYLTTIPFHGFYETSHDAMIEDEINQIFEIDRERGGDYNVPDELSSFINYKNIFKEYANLYVDAFNEHFKWECQFDLDAKFESLTSPKEYNFETDKIFAEIELGTLGLLYEKVDENKLAFAEFIKDKFTSRSGFISFYSADLSDWQDKPLETYDHNEIGTLIQFALKLESDEWDEKLSGFDLMDSARGNGEISSIVETDIPQEFFDFADKQAEAKTALDFKTLQPIEA